MTKLIKKLVEALLFNSLNLIKDTEKFSEYKSNEKIAVVTLLCHKDVNLFIQSIISFITQLKLKLPIIITDDGSLTDQDYKTIKKSLKNLNIKIIKPKDRDKKIKPLINKYANIKKYRFNKKSAITKYKLDTILLNTFRKIILLDSDVLFFNKPIEILKWINSDKKYILYMAHNPKYANEISIDGLEYKLRLLLKKYYAPKLDARFNSGLVCINKDLISLKKLDNILKIVLEINYNSNFASDETSLSILFADRDKKKLNVNKYLLAICPLEVKKLFSQNTICVHYSYLAKNLFKRAAIKLKLENAFT